jgi:pyruvate dehydrogenase E1 component beta subunit
MPVISYRDALNEALREEMQRDDRVFLMGEEVGEYDGAYKVSRGLLKEFGEMRVVDTPIAELSFSGIGVGAAMAGLRPIIEFMTWNFGVLALDQVVNAAAKMLYMSGGQFPIPIVFRGPNGAALQLSAQHSQAWESWLSHIPGLKVVAPGTPYDAKGLLKSAVRDDNPVMVLEGEMLYNLKGEVPEEEYLVPIGKADLKREGDHCSIITFGKMGIAEGVLVPIGIAELICLAIFLVPRTVVLGTFLLTGYLGGATLANIIGGTDFIHALVIGLMVWTVAWLRAPGLRELLPVAKSGRG